MFFSSFRTSASLTLYLYLYLFVSRLLPSPVRAQPRAPLDMTPYAKETANAYLTIKVLHPLTITTNTRKV